MQPDTADKQEKPC